MADNSRIFILPVEDSAAYEPGYELSRRLHRAGIALAILVLCIGSLTALVPIGGAVMGIGKIAVQSGVKRISHSTGGVIDKINVKNGEYVRQGQELLSFDDTVSSSDAELTGLTIVQLMATRARLDAEQRGAPSIDIPETLTGGKFAGAEKAIKDEQSLFEIRQSEATGLATQLIARVSQYEQQIVGFNAQITALQKQQTLIQPELEGIRSLWEKRFVTINRLNQIERTAIEFEGSIASLDANIAQALARITEAREQIIQVRQSRRSEAGTQLSTVNGILNQQQFRSVSATELQKRTTVYAIYSGYVDKLAFAAVGDVVRAAEVILEIVPDKDLLIVEGRINPADIDQVNIGQPARVTFTTLNLSDTPELLGTIIFISPELTTDINTNAKYFSIKIRFNKVNLFKNKHFKLKSGMPAEFFLKTDNRTILSYIIKPLQDELRYAFRNTN